MEHHLRVYSEERSLRGFPRVSGDSVDLGIGLDGFYGPDEQR